MYVGETIVSAINQSYLNIEIIAVDDGSTDNSLEVMQKFPITIIEHPVNKGLPFARNTGIRAASGKYILPLDSDDMLGFDAVEKMVYGFINSPNEKIGIVRSAMHVFTNGICTPTINPPFPLSHFSDQLRSNRIFITSMFPKLVWEEVEGYSEEFNDGFEDWEFWIKILSAGYKVATINDPLFWYRIHDSSKGKSRTPEKTALSHRRLYLKHRELYKKEFLKGLPICKSLFMTDSTLGQDHTQEETLST